MVVRAFSAIAVSLLLACGGQLDEGDGGLCVGNDTLATACPCATAGVIQSIAGGACACAALPGCSATRWACYTRPAACPATVPEASSACTQTMTCDYVRNDGRADELICDGKKWGAVTLTTYCP